MPFLFDVIIMLEIILTLQSMKKKLRLSARFMSGISKTGMVLRKFLFS